MNVLMKERLWKIHILEKALKMASKILANYLSSCPHEECDWDHPNTCEKQCNKMNGLDGAKIEQVMAGCWNTYLMQKAQDEETQ